MTGRVARSGRRGARCWCALRLRVEGVMAVAELGGPSDLRPAVGADLRRLMAHGRRGPASGELEPGARASKACCRARPAKIYIASTGIARAARSAPTTRLRTTPMVCDQPTGALSQCTVAVTGGGGSGRRRIRQSAWSPSEGTPLRSGPQTPQLGIRLRICNALIAARVNNTARKLLAATPTSHATNASAAFTPGPASTLASTCSLDMPRPDDRHRPPAADRGDPHTQPSSAKS